MATKEEFLRAEPFTDMAAREIRRKQPMASYVAAFDPRDALVDIATTGGFEWRHRVQTVAASFEIPSLQTWADRRASLHYKHRELAHRVGEFVLTQAAVTFVDDDMEANKETHHFRVSVVLPGRERNFFAEQRDAAYAAGYEQGLRDAEAITNAEAARYAGNGRSWFVNPLQYLAAKIRAKMRGEGEGEWRIRL